MHESVSHLVIEAFSSYWPLKDSPNAVCKAYDFKGQGIRSIKVLRS